MQRGLSVYVQILQDSMVRTLVTANVFMLIEQFQILFNLIPLRLDDETRAEDFVSMRKLVT